MKIKKVKLKDRESYFYYSIDNRSFREKDDCLEYEEWLKNNGRNIPTLEQFRALREDDIVLYCGKEYIVAEKPEREEKEYVDLLKVKNNTGMIRCAHYTEIDLIK